MLAICRVLFPHLCVLFCQATPGKQFDVLIPDNTKQPNEPNIQYKVLRLVCPLDKMPGDAHTFIREGLPAVDVEAASSTSAEMETEAPGAGAAVPTAPGEEQPPMQPGEAEDADSDIDDIDESHLNAAWAPAGATTATASAAGRCDGEESGAGAAPIPSFDALPKPYSATKTRLPAIGLKLGLATAVAVGGGVVSREQVTVTL